MKSSTIPVRDSRAGTRRRQPGTRTPARRVNKKRLAVLFFACLLVLVLLFLFGYFLIQDIALAGYVFPGVTIDGNTVGGMSRDQARSAVMSAVSAKTSGPLAISYHDNDFKLEPGRIGVAVDVDRMVDEAIKKGRRQNILARMWRRFTNEPVSADVDVILKYDKAALDGYVTGVARTLDYAARDAGVDMSKGYPVMTEAKEGRSVKQAELKAMILAAFRNGNRDLEAPVEILKPRVTESEIGPIVVVKQAEHKLYLYHGEKLQGSHPVALGQPKYPTPTGRFEILEKKKDPWWYPPKAEWARDKKPVPPGPGNPLGPYWMDLGNGLGIHSTPDEASLGYSASHGCIRMSEWGAQQLFNAVDKGTPVYILPATPGQAAR